MPHPTAIVVGKRLVEGCSRLKAARKALADIPRWDPKVVPDSAALKQANTAAEQAKAAANQSRTVASRTSREVDDAKRANDQARKAAENKKSETCNSFVPGTGVVMADGSIKAIDDVAVGDTVVAVAADGTPTHRQVVATITGHGAKELVGLTLVGSGGGGPPAHETITATDGHLFLTADGAWVPAKDLQVGDRLVDPDGTPVTIGAVEHDTVIATVHNLTVDTDHTYTVVTAAGTDVVTHNDNLLDAVGDAQDANACPLPNAPVPVTVSRARHPESAAHVEAAQAAGMPSVVTIDRAGAAARRKESMRGHPRVPGKDRDEYPPAMMAEGGTGSSVRPVTPSDNRGAGSCIGWQCRDLPDGTQIRLDVVP